MFHVILFQPEIPPNTGNIIRLCANTGCKLHLIKPMAFALDDKRMRRAGLDYGEFAEVKPHENLQDCLKEIEGRVWAFTTKASKLHTEAEYQPGDALLFGPETRGLPEQVRNDIGAERCIRLPMRANSRSLNLSNSAAIAVYEAWRQQDFK
jgi:tRNA (cytidine/uridine-2'-O-)-methyltransferase